MDETRNSPNATYVGLIGITYRRTHAEALAFFRLPEPASAADKAPLAALAEALGLCECLFLATCNRVELWFVAPHSLPITTLRRRFVDFIKALRQAPAPVDPRLLHAYVDEGAWERLFVVASALDAMVPGEAQVLGQLKAAARTSEQLGLLGAGLTPLLQAAFAAAKDVRENTALGRGRMSMMSLIEDHLDRVLAQHGVKSPVVAVVGTGEMASACAERLAARPGIELVIVSRNQARAHALAQRNKARARSFADFCESVAKSGEVSAIISATTCITPIFDAAFFSRFGVHDTARTSRVAPAFIDLGVPQNVDAKAAAKAHIDCIDYQALTKLSERHRKERSAVIAEARHRIDKRLDLLATKMRQERVKQAVRAWRAHCEQIVQQRLLTLPKDAHADSTSRWAHQLTQALAHAPTQGLKHMAEVVGPEAVMAFVRGANFSDHGR